MSLDPRIDNDKHVFRSRNSITVPWSKPPVHAAEEEVGAFNELARVGVLFENHAAISCVTKIAIQAGGALSFFRKRRMSLL